MEQVPVVHAGRLGEHAEHPTPGGIQDFHPSVSIDDEQACGETADDLSAELLGGHRARAHRALLRLQLRHRFLERGGQ